MAAVAYSEFDEALEAASRPTNWAINEIADQAKRAGVSSIEPTVTFFAKVRTESAEEFVKFAEVKASDLYAFSDAPVVELLNAIGLIRNQVKKIDSIPIDDLEFEIETVALWHRIGALKNFFNISPAHDELIAALRALGIGENGILNPPKIAALKTALSRVGDRLNLPDEVLDEFTDDLEAGGFDLDLAMHFAESE